ncbi:MAG TPA: hypothetical protein VK419_02500 [Bryobacteraceae bacterium]|nr:hypothetical protein [Bryobacteraceae bacterium]
MLRRTVWLLVPALAFAADLPVRDVVLFKNGIGYFERAGQLPAGESARLEFKAGDMNDVLKSLTVIDRAGAKIGTVRYDASEPVDKRLQDFPFDIGHNSSLAVFLDQMRGARLELQIGAEHVAGTMVSARLVPATEKDKESQTVVLLMDSGEMRAYDLAAAAAVRFPDPKLQGMLKDYLAVLSQASSKDRRSIYIDSPGPALRDLIARYTIPAPVWKSTYRLIFGNNGEPTLEGWAIVDNTTGEDWTNVHLSVVSGKPISFITQLYEPKYIQRQDVELEENRPVAPGVFGGSIGGAVGGSIQGSPKSGPARALAPAPPAARQMAGLGSTAESVVVEPADSSIESAPAQEEGELFEYSFASPVTVKKGESAMLPFLQQKIGARKLLVYRESFGLHPMDAAEIANSTGKTLDGGPFTVYDGSAYSGEAIAETIKAGDKRLISYGVDLGTRVTTAWDSSHSVVREVHFHRSVLTARSAVVDTKAYTIRNVDAKAKTLIIEHPQRAGYKLLNQTPVETTADAYRFEVKLAASGSEKFPVTEERVLDQTFSLTNVTASLIAEWFQNKALSDAGRRQLEAIAQKKDEIAENNAAMKRAGADLDDLAKDQARVRSNFESLNRVAGQQELVQQYARELASIEIKLAALRDTQSQLRHKQTALESELNSLMEKTDF